jgi:hypothetical protein
VARAILDRWRQIYVSNPDRERFFSALQIDLLERKLGENAARSSPDRVSNPSLANDNKAVESATRVQGNAASQRWLPLVALAVLGAVSFALAGRSKKSCREQVQMQTVLLRCSNLRSSTWLSLRTETKPDGKIGTP